MGSLLFAIVGGWVSGGGSTLAGCVRGGWGPIEPGMAVVVLSWDISELIDSCASFLRFRLVGATVEGSELASEEISEDRARAQDRLTGDGSDPLRVISVSFTGMGREDVSGHMKKPGQPEPQSSESK